MISVESLYREDVSDPIISVGGGKELRGPCPYCGGVDRFGVFPRQNNGEGSFFCGRFKGAANSGCCKGGDVIEYLKQFRNMSYVDACGFLGREPKNTSRRSHLRYSLPQKRKVAAKPEKFVPVDKDYPEEVVDPAMWREHGMKFVNACHEALLKRAGSIAYLMSRGISMDAIKKFKIGYHEGETKKGKQNQPSFRPWSSWGLKEEIKTNGRGRMLILPVGVVIPFIVDESLHRITIRLSKPDSRNPRMKYHYVKGSIRDLWLTNPKAKAFVTIEAELDAIAVDSAAGDLVGTIGIGSTGVKPDKRSAAALQQSICILGSLDFDTPRKNPKTGKLEIPGAFGSKWWSENYRQHKRWPVPVGKDPGEAFEAGIDLRTWIIAGLPEQLVPAGPSKISKQNDTDVEPSPDPSVQMGKDICAFPKACPGEDLQEFRKRLYESRAIFRVYDNQLGLGLEVPRWWSDKNPEKKRRLSDLLFSSVEVGLFVAKLPDGIYDASHVRS